MNICVFWEHLGNSADRHVESTYFKEQYGWCICKKCKHSTAPTELHSCTECQGVTSRCYCSLCWLLSEALPDPIKISFLAKSCTLSLLGWNILSWTELCGRWGPRTCNRIYTWQRIILERRKLLWISMTTCFCVDNNSEGNLCYSIISGLIGFLSQISCHNLVIFTEFWTAQQGCVPTVCSASRFSQALQWKELVVSNSDIWEPDNIEKEVSRQNCLSIVYFRNSFCTKAIIFLKYF